MSVESRILPGVRASRLVSLLLLLQDRGRLTARQLADELDVSVRTVYRDVEHLAAAGIPLYGEAGHAGGYRLVDGYRTRLTGLTADEAQAVFLAGLPGPAAQLGLGEVLAAAQLKLRAALPPALRPHAARVQQRFLLDAPGWYDQGPRPRFLPEAASAVWERHVLAVRYRRWKAPTEVDRRIAPYGLVLKAGRWYLVAAPLDGGEPGAARTYRVDQVLDLTVLRDQTFEPPAEFDLTAHWEAYIADFHARLYTGEAEIRLSPTAVARISAVLGETIARAVAETGTAEPDGWTRARVPIESVAHAHDDFLRLGVGLEVVAPGELRDRVADTVRALAARYA